MDYPTSMTRPQWEVVQEILHTASKRGPKFDPNELRTIIDAMLYVTHTGCQWRYLPGDFGGWTRVWSQFRRWSDPKNGTFERLLAGVHEQVRLADGRLPKPSMVIIDTHLARASSNRGATFHDRGGPYGRTKGAKRTIAVDITGQPLCARVVAASTKESDTTALLIEDIKRLGQADRLTLVLVDHGVCPGPAAKLSKRFAIEVRPQGWNPKPTDANGKRIFKALPYAWRVEIAHGQLMRSRRLSKSFENSPASATAWLQLACIANNLSALL